MDLLSAEIFQKVKRLILARGDRQTYCNRYNHNPHYGFAGFDVFLDPKVGSGNIDCDPARSDFDALVIRDWNAPGTYFEIRASREEAELVYDRGQRRRLVEYLTVMLAEAERLAPR